MNAPLANHVRPAHYETRTLHVNADSPVWASRARLEAREMIVRLRREKYFKDITRIEVKIKPRGGGLDRETLLKMSKPRDTQRPPAKPIRRTPPDLLICSPRTLPTRNCARR